MNKKIVLIGVLALMLVVGGVSYSRLKSGKFSFSSPSSSPKSEGAFSSIKDALSKSISLSCEFTDDTGRITKSYIKNGAVRITNKGRDTNNQAGEVIIKGKVMHVWDEKTKQGFVYESEEEPDSSTSSSGNYNSSDGSSYLSMIDKYKDYCKVQAVEDSLFTIPEDVKFQDMSQFLKNIKSSMPSTPNN